MYELTPPRRAASSSIRGAVAALLTLACGAGAAFAQGAPGARAIEGIWDSTVTSKDCASGAALGPPFKALIVFRRGGSFDVDSTQGRTARGSIYGLWKQEVGPAFSANAVHLRYNPDGTYAGLNKIQRSVTLAADAASFTSTLAVQILDLNGNVVGEVCPTEAAVRMNL